MVHAHTHICILILTLLTHVCAAEYGSNHIKFDKILQLRVSTSTKLSQHVEEAEQLTGSTGMFLGGEMKLENLVETHANVRKRETHPDSKQKSWSCEVTLLHNALQCHPDNILIT